MNPSKRTVLCIDDDHNLQVVITHYLEDDGYKVVTVGSVAAGVEKVQTLPLDIILLDLMLPDGEGLELLAQVRGKTAAAIIVVSGKTDTTEKIICLEMGADDYMTKPFEMRELSARIKAVMRRKEPQKQISNDRSVAAKEKIELGNGWLLERTQYQLFDNNGNSANLTIGEFKLLEALVLAPNRALTREHLFDLTRDGEFDIYDRAIDIQVGRLRKKINDDSSDMIKTVRGIGYMFCPIA